MNAPEGYNVDKCLHTSPKTLVYAATRISDGKPVVLKVHRCGDALDAARREFSLLARAAGPGIVGALELDELVDPPLLVLERIEGASLLQYADGSITLERFLVLAHELARAIAGLHQHRLIHRDVTPDNVWVHEGGEQVWLIDFGLVLEYGGNASAAVHAEALTQGIARYMAPEQSGRMARGVDFRSDLYSLGATLHHLWCGQPPFAGSEILELIHAHTAVAATPLGELRRDTPATVSRIVQKLLQKDPDDRYQSARSLVDDLAECRRQLEETGDIDPELPLGTADIATRALFSHKLYGRETETEALGAALERVRQGRREMWMIRGAPGVGKSVLVDALRARVLEQRGCLVQGKFDLYRRDLQYHGWTQALAALVDHLLARGHADTEEWTQRLRDQLGNTAAALLEIAPDLRFLLSEIRPVPQLGPAETQIRLGATLARLVQAVATPAHPLVIVLDDLQWADAGSRALLLELLRSDRDAALLILGTHRDNEDEVRTAYADLLERLRAAEVPVHEIELGPLAPEASVRMLAEALHRPADEVRSLAEGVLRKTGNNPFLVQQFVEHMRTLELIRYQAGTGWTWNDAEIAAADIPEGAVGLMVEKIERLAPHVREVLVFASFVGDEFDAELLRALARRELHAIEAALFALSEAGMILPCRAGFRFGHDRIREAAQSLLSEEDRASLHYDTANLLFGRLSDDERRDAATELADQFNRALHRVRPEQRLSVIQLNVWAAQRALAAGATDSARVYAEAAATLVRDDDASTTPDLIFDLGYARARTRAIAGEHADAEAILEPLTAQARSPDQLARVVSLRVEILALVAREEDGFDGPCAQHATRIATRALRELGAPYPADPGPLRALLQALLAYWKLRHTTVDELMERAAPPDERQAAMAEIESSLSSVFFARRFRSLYYTGYVVRKLERGYAGPNLPLALTTLGAVLGHLFHWNEGAERLGDLALELIRRGYPSTRNHRTIVHCAYGLHAWTRHLRSCVTDLERTIQPAIEEGGDPMMASTAGAIVNRLRHDMGSPVAVLRKTTHAGSKLGARASDFGFMRATEYGEKSLARLADPSPIEVGEPLREHSGLHWGELARGFFWFVMSEFELAQEAYGNLPETDGFPTREPFHRGLSCAVCLWDAAPERKRHYRRTLRRDLRQLRRWAARSPGNFRHQVLLLEAEWARLERRPAQALRLVQESLQRALDSDYPMDATFARERWACYLLDARRGIEAARLLQQVLDFWHAWGAGAKVTHLGRQHGDVLSILDRMSS